MLETDEFSWLMGILEGQAVAANIFSGTNVCGYTNAEQLREAYQNMNPDHKFWIQQRQLESFIAKFGYGRLGFNMSGMFCEQTPEEIEKLLVAAQEEFTVDCIAPAKTKAEYQKLLNRWRLADNTAKSEEPDIVRERAINEVMAISDAIRSSPFGVDASGSVVEGTAGGFSEEDPQIPAQQPTGG